MPLAKFSSKFVASAKCPPSQAKVDFFDVYQKGFMLEVRRSGGKTFYQRYTDDRGRTRQFKLGPAEFLSVQAARKLGRSVVAQAITGSDPHQRRAALREIPTLRQMVLDRYLPYVKSYKRSWTTDDAILRTHVLPSLGVFFIDQIQSEQISAIVSRMRSAGYATGTMNRVVIVLRHLYNLARKWRVGNITSNPTDDIPLAPDVCRERYLSLEEAQALINSLQQDENQIAAQAITLLLLTGARRNEITHAKWDQIDWDRRTLNVPLAKSGKSRRIVLNSSAVGLLRGIRRTENDYIFASPLTGRPSKSLHFPWVRIKARAGLSDLRLHDLRHSFASFLVNEGVSLYAVQSLLGHSAARYTQRYAHLTSKTLFEAAEHVDKIMFKQR